LTTDATGDALAAALIQISSHAERISGLDTREASHYQEIADRLRDLADSIGALTTRVDGVGSTVSQQASILGGLDGLDQQVASLTAQITELACTLPSASCELPGPSAWNTSAGLERTVPPGMRSARHLNCPDMRTANGLPRTPTSASVSRPTVVRGRQSRGSARLAVPRSSTTALRPGHLSRRRQAIPKPVHGLPRP
jgi:hypothetical protein